METEPIKVSLINYILVIFISVLPLITPFYNLEYEQAKVVVFILGITVYAILVILSNVISHKQDFYTIPKSLIGKFSVSFILVLALTSVLGVNPTTSIFGVPPYFQGIILYLFFYFFYIVVVNTSISIRLWALALSISSCIVSLLIIKDWVEINFFNISLLTYSGRVIGTFGQPNFTAGYILLCLPFVFLLLKDKENKIIRAMLLTTLIVSIIGIYISGSRSALMLLAGILFMYLMTSLNNHVKIIKYFFVVVIISVTLSGVFLPTGLIWDEIIEPLTIHDSANLERRIYFWPAIASLIMNKPVLGYGLENLKTVFPSYESSVKDIKSPLHGIKRLKLDRSHNYTLDVAFFSGIIGIIVWILLIYSLLKKSMVNSRFLWMGLVAYLLWVQLQNQSVIHLIYFWLIVGLIDNCPLTSTEKI